MCILQTRIGSQTGRSIICCYASQVETAVCLQLQFLAFRMYSMIMLSSSTQLSDLLYCCYSSYVQPLGESQWGGSIIYFDCCKTFLRSKDVKSLGGIPLYGLYGYVRPKRVWFFSRFDHKLGIDFSHSAAILVINRVSIFARQSSIGFFFLEEATSSPRLPSPIRALPSSTLFNAYAYACLTLDKASNKNRSPNNLRVRS